MIIPGDSGLPNLGHWSVGCSQANPLSTSVLLNEFNAGEFNHPRSLLKSAGTLATTGPQGPARAIPFFGRSFRAFSPTCGGFMAPGLGDLRGARAFPLFSTHLARHLSRRFLARLGALLRPGHFCSWAAKKTHGPATANDIEQAGQAAVEIAAEIMKEAQQLANGTTG